MEIGTCLLCGCMIYDFNNYNEDDNGNSFCSEQCADAHREIMFVDCNEKCL